MGLTRASTGRMRVGTGKREGTDGTIALAGNPNVGKSSVFNALTGLRQHTGNWPGKTVEVAQGTVRHGEKTWTLVDLPGTYSLSAASPEEEIAADCVRFGDTDGIVVVCDATGLERSLYLSLQILSVTDRVVVCVNLMDEADRRGLRLDLERLEKWLSVPVTGISARKKSTLPPLMDEMEDLTEGKVRRETAPTLWPERVLTAMAPLTDILKARFSPVGISVEWMAYELLRKEKSEIDKLSHWCGEDLAEDEALLSAREKAWEALDRRGIADQAALERVLAEHLLRLSERICEDVVSAEETDRDRRDGKVDRFLTGRLTGYPLMLLLLALVFWITIRGADLPSRLLSQALFRLGDLLSQAIRFLGAPDWLHDMLILGMYRVLAWVISVMLPPMAIFFPLFTLLEDVGYLPRIAFNLDRPFQRCRSCGKQALTMAMGFGCNAAGVVGCRIIQSPRERLLAVLTNSLVPCNGRFPILIALLGLFFSRRTVLSALGLTGLVLLSVAVTFAATKLLAETVCRGESSSFLLELPPYRLPNVGQVLVRSVLDRTLFVLGRAAAVAAPAGIALWILANTQWNGAPLLRWIAQALHGTGRFLGMDGVMVLAFILGFPANETVIPIALMIYLAEGSLSPAVSMSDVRTILVENGWTWTTAGSVLLFTLFHWPCSTTLLTVRKETGKWRYALLAAAVPTVCGVLACSLFHGIALLFQ